MRRLIKLLSICMLILFLTGCVENENIHIGDSKDYKDDKSDVDKKDTKDNYHKITIEEIKGNYSEESVKNIYPIGEDYILLEFQEPTTANHFDMYNLKTGEVDSLPKGAEFVTIEEIIDENEIIFLASGKESETNVINFPHLIRCLRIKNNINEIDDYSAYNEDKYFSLDYSIEGGSKERAIISEVRTREDGLEVSFSPIAGEEANFYAGTTDIPPTKTAYDKERNTLILEISTKELSKDLKVNEKIKIDNNSYINAYEIVQKDSKTFIEVSLNEAAKAYSMRKDKDKKDIPYFSVVFR